MLIYLSEDEVKRRLRSGELTVAIYGMGYVGVPLACAWLRAGAKVIGVDVDEEKVRLLNEGRSPVPEPGVSEVIKHYLSIGKFRATTNGVEASKLSDVKIVTVPVSLRGEGGEKAPDFTNLIAAIRDIAKGLKRGDLVIIESSVPPGTTLEVVKPILEEVSGLRAEEDFGLVYSPERVAEGRVLYDIEEAYPKIIGGVGTKSTRTAKALYEVIARKGVIVVSSPTTAEFEKLAEGVYRDVNIALANELATLARALGVDFHEVRVAANSQPYCHLHTPGTGVGGMCIPVYPYFMMWVARKLGIELKLTKLAREINELAPKTVIDLAVELCKLAGLSIERCKVAILGLAFRGDIADSRASPTYDLIKYLRRFNVREVVVHDPLITFDKELDRLGVPLVSDISAAVKGAQVIIVSTDHTTYRRISLKWLLDMCSVEPLVVVDGRDVLDIATVPSGKVYYVGIGRGFKIR